MASLPSQLINPLIVSSGTYMYIYIFIHKLFISYRELEDRAKVKYPGRLNPANFGRFGHCYCICEKPGQAPCPALVPHPDAKKPKFWQLKQDTAAE